MDLVLRAEGEVTAPAEGCLAQAFASISAEGNGAFAEGDTIDFNVAPGTYPAGSTLDAGTITFTLNESFQAAGSFTVAIAAGTEDNCGINGSDGFVIDVDTATRLVQFSETAGDAPTSDTGAINVTNAQPGQTISVEFQVSSQNPPMTLETDIGSVTPPGFEANSGMATFNYEVPTDAEPGFTDSGGILVTDSGQSDGLFIPVQISVGSQELSEQEGLTPRQRSVANSLDAACGALREIPEEERTSRQNDLIATCDRAAESGTPGAIYDGLAPEEVAAQGRASMQTMRQQLQNVGSRITELRAGATGFSARGFNVALDGERLPVNMFTNALGAGASDDILAFSNFGFFVNGSAAFGNRQQTDNEQGFRSRTLGLTAGLDYRFSPQTIGGVALGYTRTDTDLRNNAGGVDVDGYSLSLYGTHFLPRSFYVDGIVTVGRNRYDTVRTVFSGPDGQSAKARPDGMEYAVGLNAGYDLSDGPWTVGFQTSLDYIRVEIDSYRERATNSNNPGAGSLLRIDSQTIESKTAEVAVQLSYAENYPWGVMVYSTRWGLEREFSDDSRRINARFIEDPTNTRFSLRTDDPDRTYMNIGGGLTAQFARGRAAYLFLESVEGRSGYSLYTVDVGFRMEF
ncbi:outer membrane autotransporter protein [Natronocella acetinitrilica]|uniref:Outer membrane autotransporter protein n=1 Tax=Natronocella acetinitrilica TaxID=414046 RepID=A0AAE3G1R0_9GAMM|nr:outer membrane autotransporter protein [Natronocella acetinitrilica]